MRELRKLFVKELKKYTSDAKNIELKIYKSGKDRYIDNVYQLLGLYEESQLLKDINQDIDIYKNDMIDRYIEEVSTSIFHTDIFKNVRLKTIKEQEIQNNIQESEFPCKKPKCRSRNTYSIQSQTRGGDEGMTTFVICKDCGYRYRFC